MTESNSPFNVEGVDEKMVQIVKDICTKCTDDMISVLSAGYNKLLILNIAEGGIREKREFYLHLLRIGFVSCITAGRPGDEARAHFLTLLPKFMESIDQLAKDNDETETEGDGKRKGEEDA